MYLLQLVSLEEQNKVPVGTTSPLMAVARADNPQLLHDLLHRCLSLGQDGTTIEIWTGVLEDQVTPCHKHFRAGTPLEFYAIPEDQSQVIVHLPDLEERIETLRLNLVERVTAEWNSILTNVVALNTDADVMELRTVNIEQPESKQEKTSNV